MKIVYVGNFTQPHCTEVHLAKTLESMGHEVVRLQENGPDLGGFINGTAADVAVLLKPDLLMWTRTWVGHVTLDDLKRIEAAGIPTVSYHLDLYVGLKREEGLDSDPFWRTQHVFTPDGSAQAAEIFASKGINHHYLKPGVFKPECADGKYRPELAHDVAFVGSGNYMHDEWPYRGRLIEWLRATYQADTENEGPIHSGVTRFGKYGNPERIMRGKDLNDLYASAKVIVGDSLCIGFTKDHYWSDRVYETIGRGGFLIHPYIKGLEEEFTDGETIVFYEFGNFDELRAKIDFYLRQDYERERIRKAGQEFVREHATYNDRLVQMLDVVFPEMPSTDGLHINLGAGEDQFKGFVNVDFLDLPGIDVVHNLMSFPYPFEDESAVEIKAVDVVEHLANYTEDGRPSVIAFIEECHRILKPGGELFIQTPRYDADFLWLDPTHVRGFHEQSFDFFDPDKHFGQTTGFYSKAKFSVRSEVLTNKNLRIWMTKR